MAVDSKAKILRDAEKYVYQGKIPQAIAEYQKIIKSDPADVLTLNTIGDLCLRQGKIQEANGYFAKVADSYSRNNFTLKAIAVYKKILTADPDNLDVNITLAGLHSKQGLNVDARNQYLRVADISSKLGKEREALAAYEKVVELDPSNFGVWTKLAEVYLKEGAKDRAHASFVGAARALTKSGDLRAAIASYKRAALLNPVNREAMKGYLDVSLQAGDLSGILDQLKKSLVISADDTALLEMLGLAQLANKDFDDASKTLETLVSLDESRYGHFFPLCDAYIELGDYDRAARAIDTIVPILITRRESERAVEAYTGILKANPEHILSLTLLASLFASIGDQVRQLETLEKLAVLNLSQQFPREALDQLELILQIRPEDEKYLNLHRQAFEEAFPGTPYSPPAPPPAAAPDIAAEFGYTESSDTPDEVIVIDEQPESDIVEIDLLMNYGMSEKALSLLLPMEQRDPANVEVRTRLLSLYRDLKHDEKAAEECLCLAALYQNAGDEAGAKKMMEDARILAPELVDSDFDLQPFALQHGITATGTPVFDSSSPPPAVPARPKEVDLSEDLSSLFTTNLDEFSTSEGMDAQPEAIADEIARQIPQRSSEEAIQAQFQEVDFYIRLGFHDEARAKLDEVAREAPDNPELALRYSQLEEAAGQQPDKATAMGSGETGPDIPVETTPPDGGDIFEELKIDRAAERFVEDYTSETIARKSESSAEMVAATREPVQEAAPVGKVNAMFADLLDEVNSLTDSDIAQGDFETHFNLGIAYRGMALIDEAIKEFQTAVKILDPAKSPKEVIQCCGMLSTCFIEKGMPRSAIRWCQTGLTIKEISPHESMALRYDMGVAHALIGEQERALECFTAVFSKDPSYRDVAQKIDDLKAHS